MGWLSLRERSVSLSLNLQQPNPALEKQLRPSNVQSARARSSLLLRERTERTKTARLNKNLRKPKKGQSSPWFCKIMINPSPASNNPGTLLGVKIRKNLSRFEHFSQSTFTNTTMKAGKLQNRNFKFDAFKHLYFSCFH